jgi:hypothetical protein
LIQEAFYMIAETSETSLEELNLDSPQVLFSILQSLRQQVASEAEVTFDLERV